MSISKEPKIVTDIDNMLHTIGGKTWLRKEVEFFEGKRKDKLFNAIWNNEFCYEVDEDLATRIKYCITYGKKIFNVTMLEDKINSNFYAFKESKEKSIFIEYKLYESEKNNWRD